MAVQNPPHERSPGDLRQGTDQLLFLCRVLAFPVEICVTRFGTWGPQYLDFSSVLGFFWPLVFVGLTAPHPAGEVRAVVLFWWGSLVLLLVHRVAGLRRRARGYRCHSRNRGASWFARVSDPVGSGRSNARDCLAVVGAGIVIAAVVSRPLGLLLLLGSAALLATRLVMHLAIEARLREMEDLWIEHEFLAERFRERTDRR
ncbi:MAG TPA: hypothetical protein VH092_06385 [Urbifossiella sp.]|jgi:hypothetical protein|nr:hypothetical protein [Urbifossiella sp.]